MTDKTIDWSKPIQASGYDPEDMPVSAIQISEENGFAEIEVLYAAHPLGMSSADFTDTYCVDYRTGNPLNCFLGNKFAIINQE